MEEIRAVKAFREIDKREIYILSKLNFKNWADTVDTLIDSEFDITAIKLADYYVAVDSIKWCYKLKNDDFESFLAFIKDNYEVHTGYHKQNLENDKAPF
jgi:hypothetical protein